MPQQLARLCIQRICIISAGDEHDARDDDGRYLERTGVPGMEDPLC